MKCACEESMLSKYIERDLDAEVMEQMKLHVQGCPACLKEMKRLKTALRIMRSLEEVAPPRDYLETVNHILKRFHS